MRTIWATRKRKQAGARPAAHWEAFRARLALKLDMEDERTYHAKCAEAKAEAHKNSLMRGPRQKLLSHWGTVKIADQRTARRRAIRCRGPRSSAANNEGGAVEAVTPDIDV